MVSTTVVLAALFLPVTAAPPVHRAAAGPTALERKLHGKWTGPACGGDLTLRASGAFERQHYGPGNETLSGTWVVRWDALPPTLVLTCKDADYLGAIGTVEEVKVVQLDDETLTYQRAAGDPTQYKRVKR
jgi:hypothetical protein